VTLEHAPYGGEHTLSYKLHRACAAIGKKTGMPARGVLLYEDGKDGDEFHLTWKRTDADAKVVVAVDIARSAVEAAASDPHVLIALIEAHFYEAVRGLRP
jgi:hypothetical protein